MKLTKYLKVFLFILSFIALSSCKKKEEVKIVPTPTPKVVQIELSERPNISLVPREDGHELKLTISNIPNIIKQIEYEFIYSATDEGLQIEKGLAGTLQIEATKASQDLLLGTASCTNGCKYKYDSGVNGGSLHLTLTTNQNQIALFDTNFILSTSADIKKSGLTLNDLTIKATPKQNEYFVLIQDYNQNYLVFSSISGQATIQSITEGFIKEDKNKLTGTYSK